ncbi:MAG TPA: hypothetical protein VFT43_13780 [Candidatus Polarisedimenticolia bacterium]|nr:hypothetical protein [Candidatus Polarisedimenticolia bacterium]
MTKADLIRTILERCRVQVRASGSGALRPSTKSPAAGGGLAGVSDPARERAGATLRHPQTGGGFSAPRHPSRKPPPSGRR